MPAENILYPVFAMVLLTFVVWLSMYYVRFSQMKKLGIDPQSMQKTNPALPKAIKTSGDNFSNLCELPLLFYTLAAFLYITGRVDGFYVYGAWLFVFLRSIHSFIHTTYNRVLHRFGFYLASSLTLWILWGRFMVGYFRG